MLKCTSSAVFVRYGCSPASVTMMTTKRLDNFQLVCEWDSCDFDGHSMEELSDHMSLHLKDYLGDKDALEELGKSTFWFIISVYHICLM